MRKERRGGRTDCTVLGKREVGKYMRKESEGKERRMKDRRREFERVRELKGSIEMRKWENKLAGMQSIELQ